MLLGWLPLGDAPGWARIVAHVIPIGSTLWLVAVVRQRLARPAQCVLDGIRREVRLVAPGPGWLERIGRERIVDCAGETERDADGDRYTLVLRTDTGALAIFTLQSEARAREIAAHLAAWLPVRTLERPG